MKLSRIDTQSLMFQLSEAELLILKSCLREAFATLHRKDFPLRIGTSIETAAKLADELNAQMRSVGIEE